MRVTISDVEKIAGLAKLSVTGEEKAKFRGQLEEMLDYVEKLNELDTDGVEPTFFVQHGTESLRPDQVTESLPRDEALQNAPASTLGFFKVPKIIPQAEKKG
jgi:aspartyl-tRNA(Asn)/glutamyl-tRNA(Gln) amidotransferase subunit C